jgi:tetratricopeptide (TPR) repeat protein
VLKALHKKPEGRYQSVEQMVEALCKATDRPVPDWVREGRVEPLPPEEKVRPERQVLRPVRRPRLALFGALAIVCLLLLGGWFIHQNQRRQQAAMHYNRGVIYLNGGSWEVAIYEFDQALAIDSGYEDAVEKRAEAQKQLELKSLLEKADDLYADADWAACVEKLEQMRELDPDYDRVKAKLFDAHRNYGQVLVEDDQLSQAVEQFDKAMELDPESAEVQAERNLLTAYLEGVAAHNAGQWEDAIESLTEVYDSRTDFKKTRELLYTAYVKRGQELVEAGDVEEGNACCEAALEIKPGGSEALVCLRGVEDQQYLAHVSKGNELLDDGQLDKARAEFEKALDIQPGGAEAQACLDEVYEAHVAKGNELLDDCKLDEAQAECEEALDIQSGGAEAQACLDKVNELKTPQAILIANAKSDYSRTQGYNNWYYMCWVDRGWEEMPWDVGDNHWQCRYDINIKRTPRGISDQIRFYDDRGHPGPHELAARVWQSPISDQIKITGTARKEDTRGGDGVTVKIMHNSRQLWEERITYYDNVGEAFNLYTTVQKGDKIYFIIGSGGRGDATYDLTYLNPSIYAITDKCQTAE